MIWLDPPPLPWGGWAASGDVAKVLAGGVLGAGASIYLAIRGERADHNKELEKARRASIEKIGTDFIVISYATMAALMYVIASETARLANDTRGLAAAEEMARDYKLDPAELNRRLREIQARCRFYKLSAGRDIEKYHELLTLCFIPSIPTIAQIKENRRNLEIKAEQIMDSLADAFH